MSAEVVQQKSEPETVYCVFLWRADGKYERGKALHEYKTRGGAEGKAGKLNDETANRPYVVREIST